MVLPVASGLEGSWWVAEGGRLTPSGFLESAEGEDALDLTAPPALLVRAPSGSRPPGEEAAETWTKLTRRMNSPGPLCPLRMRWSPKVFPMLSFEVSAAAVIVTR